MQVKKQVRTRHGKTDWFQIRKGVHHGCILSPCLFNLYAEYSTRNAGLDETQAGIKISGRNINNLRYADDTIFMTESEEEIKSLLRKGKEESEKAGLKLNIQKTKIMAPGLITSWQIDGEIVTDFIFLGSKITADGHMKLRHLILERKAMTNLESVLKSRDITLLTKVHLVKAMVFPVIQRLFHACAKHFKILYSLFYWNILYPDFVYEVYLQGHPIESVLNFVFCH